MPFAQVLSKLHALLGGLTSSAFVADTNE